MTKEKNTDSTKTNNLLGEIFASCNHVDAFFRGEEDIMNYDDDEFLEIIRRVFGRGCRYVKKEVAPPQLYLDKIEERRERTIAHIQKSVKVDNGLCALFSDL